jgi:hypothetical protein
MMTATASDGYATSILRPQLKSLGLNSSQQSIVLSDVCRRLNSLLTHWPDSSFRRTALMCGVEEATFYEPATAEPDIRALVVVGVRNSLVEDLGASRPATPELRLRHRALTDSGMRRLTSAAIEYFCQYDFGQLRSLPEVPADNDIFGSLSVIYPNAWRVLSALANSAGTEVTYGSPDTGSFDRLPPGSTGKTTESATRVVSSGIDPAMDGHLTSYLSQIKDRECSLFFSDSFKGVTRNPDKLLYIVECVLTHGGSFVTHNYYLGQTYASRRLPLLRPFHLRSEVIARFGNQLGLSDRHRQALDEVRSQVEEE